METQKYLQDLFHLEASCYEQRQILRSLREQLHRTQSAPDREHIGGRYEDDSGLGLYHFVIPIFAAIIVDIFAPSWIAIGIGAIILFFQWYLTYPKEAIEHNKRERARVVAENQKIDEQNRQRRERKPVLCAALSEQIAYTEASLSNTMQTLDSLYGLNLIFPKYRNYTAIASFYEYFCSGRCKELIGHEGAYNIFEQEVRMGIIIDKLDSILERLDQIEKNQYTIARSIRESNQRAEQIYSQMCECANTLQGIEQNTTLIGYFSAIEAVNSAYIRCYLSK